jgi:hypothetical protein
LVGGGQGNDTLDVLLNPDQTTVADVGFIGNEK